MASQSLIFQEKMSLKRSVQEGIRCLNAIRRCRQRGKELTAEYNSNLKKIMCMLDKYSKYKVQQTERSEILMEINSELDYISDELEMLEDEEDAFDTEDEEDEDEEEDAEYDGSLESLDLDAFEEEHVQYLKTIEEEHASVSNMEVLIRRMIRINNILGDYQRLMYSQLRLALRRFCRRARAALKRVRWMIQGNRTKTEGLRMMCNMLRELLNRVEKKRTRLKILGRETLGESLSM